MEKSIHNSIINSVAKDILKPMGLYRKGQSRIWFDDNVWFNTIVEYQPSGWSKGTYLNVGVNFNWCKKDFAFQYGYRVHDFIEFHDVDQFKQEVIELTNIGLSKVLEYRNFNNITYAKNIIMNFRDGIWNNYHKAIICLLTGDDENFLLYYDKVINDDQDKRWVIEIKDNITELLPIYKDKTLIINHITDVIYNTRELNKFYNVEKDEIRQKISAF